MSERLTDKRVNCLGKPSKGCRIYYDSLIKGFGVSVTAKGAKSFILNYRIYGRERRIAIGSYPAWTVSTAREQANKLRLEIDNGIDPLEKRQIQRAAWTVKDLFEECDNKHIPNLAPRAQGDVRSMWKRYILPRLLVALRNSKLQGVRLLFNPGYND